MADEKQTPDSLAKTTADDITLTEADLNQVSGGHAPGADLKIDYKE
jgi:bacteriocin-like protein